MRRRRRIQPTEWWWYSFAGVTMERRIILVGLVMETVLCMERRLCNVNGIQHWRNSSTRGSWTECISHENGETNMTIPLHEINCSKFHSFSKGRGVIPGVRGCNANAETAAATCSLSDATVAAPWSQHLATHFTFPCESASWILPSETILYAPYHKFCFVRYD